MMLGLDTSKKQGIFGTYVMLWVSSHVLVYASKMPGAPQYNATSVVLITEAVKLVMALAFYRRYDGDGAQLVREVRGSTDLLLQYVVPALLYCVYNNLVYVNLTFFDPGTYNVLMQLRIVLTGVLYQLLFSTRLGRNQWLAIVLIMLGCVCKESPKLFGAAGRVPSALSHAWVLLAFQMACSVFAGVYNEKLLKKDGKDGRRVAASSGRCSREGPSTSRDRATCESCVARGTQPALLYCRRVGTNLQNAYMYLNSIWCNLAFLVLNGTLLEAVHPDNLRAVFSPTVLAIVAIMASVGMVTAFFLQPLPLPQPLTLPQPSPLPSRFPQPQPQPQPGHGLLLEDLRLGPQVSRLRRRGAAHHPALDLVLRHTPRPRRCARRGDGGRRRRALRAPSQWPGGGAGRDRCLRA